jgi:hypothetical protein
VEADLLELLEEIMEEQGLAIVEVAVVAQATQE